MSLNEEIALKAETIINTVTQTDYQHTDHIDAAAGIYDCDCNGFVGYVLKTVAPEHLGLIPEEKTQPRPRAFKYFGYFASLTPASRMGWRRVDLMEHVRRGDIVAWRNPLIEKDENTGHVFIAAESPTLQDEVFSIRVYDSAEVPHFDDTRPNAHGTNGVGSGFLKFKADGAGRPIAYVFSPQTTASFSYNQIAIGRVEAI